MLILKIFHGTYKAVTQECRKVVKRLVAGESLTAAVRTDDALESTQTSDEIMLDHPYPGNGATPAFYVEPLGEMLGEGISSDRRFSLEREQALFAEFLEHPWGLVTILGRQNAQSWLVESPSRMRQYLQAVERHRLILDAAGECFVGGTHGSPRSWWNFPHGVGFSLVNLGVPIEQARAFGHTGTMPEWRSLSSQLELAS